MGMTRQRRAAETLRLQQAERRCTPAPAGPVKPASLPFGVPDHMIGIWIEGDELVLHYPDAGPSRGATSRITIGKPRFKSEQGVPVEPLNAKGLDILIEILRQRATTRSRGIATLAAPTTHRALRTYLDDAANRRKLEEFEAKKAERERINNLSVDEFFAEFPITEEDIKSAR